MSDLRQVTIDTYNQSAKELAEYFKGIGPRSEHIEMAFQAAGNPDEARIVEIGCGDGRDAKEIIRRAGWYQGFDISDELIKIAREHAPDGNFVVADAVTFDFPPNINIVFSFASLLHLDKEEVARALEKVHDSLVDGGIFYISLKYAPVYESKVKDDRFGRRLFYFYNAQIIQELAGDKFTTINTWRETHGNTDWFEIILKKT